MNKIIHSTTELFLSFKFKKTKKTHNLFSKFISSSKSVLLLAGEPALMDNALSEIIEYFVVRKKELTIIIPSTGYSRFSNIKSVQFINYNPIDINFCGFPKADFLTNLIDKKFDITIDLSIGNNLFNNYLIRFSHSDFSIGFEKHNSDKYYNFQVKPEIISENSYKNLLNSIRMF